MRIDVFITVKVCITNMRRLTTATLYQLSLDINSASFAQVARGFDAQSSKHCVYTRRLYSLRNVLLVRPQEFQALVTSDDRKHKKSTDDGQPDD